MLALLLVSGCDSSAPCAKPDRITVFELSYTPDDGEEVHFRVTESSFAKHIKILGADDLLRGELKIQGADIEIVGDDFASSKTNVTRGGISFSRAMFEEVGVSFEAVLFQNGEHVISIHQKKEGKPKSLFSMGDSNQDGEINFIDMGGMEGDFWDDHIRVLSGEKEGGDIDQLSYHKDFILKITPERWSRLSYRAGDKSIAVKVMDTGERGATPRRKNGKSRPFPYRLMRAGYLDDEAYAALIEACADDCRTGETNVTPSRVLQSIDASLLAEAESPLESFQNRDAVFRYGDVLIAYLLDAPTVAEDALAQPPQHAYDICRWVISGLRKEHTLGCQRYAIRSEQKLLNHYAGKGNANPSLGNLFREWHLKETGQIFNSNVESIGNADKMHNAKAQTEKSVRARIEKDCLRLGKKAESCKTAEDVRKLLEQAQRLIAVFAGEDKPARNQKPFDESEIPEKIKEQLSHATSEEARQLMLTAQRIGHARADDGAPSYRNRIRHLIESYFIPDLELHLMKRDVRQR